MRSGSESEWEETTWEMIQLPFEDDGDSVADSKGNLEECVREGSLKLI